MGMEEKAKTSAMMIASLPWNEVTFLLSFLLYLSGDVGNGGLPIPESIVSEGARMRSVVRRKDSCFHGATEECHLPTWHYIK